MTRSTFAAQVLPLEPKEKKQPEELRIFEAAYIYNSLRDGSTVRPT